MIALAALRTDGAASAPETELVCVERHGDRIVLTMDDGQVVNVNAWELIGAVATSEPAEVRAA